MESKKMDEQEYRDEITTLMRGYFKLLVEKHIRLRNTEFLTKEESPYPYSTIVDIEDAREDMIQFITSIDLLDGK
jgi:hypothetical protein